MKRIGLTGGMGSGKSTVAHYIATHGITIIDADVLARDVVTPGSPVLARISEEFGDEVIDADGSLRRGELARRAFRDEAATNRLNAIMHPAIKELSSQCFASAEARGDAVVVYDMPLLIELGWHRDMDLTVVVVADEDTRIRRLISNRGMDEDDVRRRLRAQLTDEQRQSCADVVIDNNGDEAALRAQVDEFLARHCGVVPE